MADLLSISRRTFFNKIKGQNLEPENGDDKECEFCLRNFEKGIEPSLPAITQDMKEKLKNACDGHKVLKWAVYLKLMLKH